MTVESVSLSGSAIQGIDHVHYAKSIAERGELPTKVYLGRIRPVAVVDTSRFRIRVYTDGTQVVTPLLNAHFDEKATLTPLPASTDYRSKASASIARMYLNDQYGDCVIAGKYHAVGVWTGNKTGTPVLGTDQEVLSNYHSICGPGDNGCVITRVLDTMKSRGLPFNGVIHKIDAYAAVDWTNIPMSKTVIVLDGASTIGINLPQAWTQNAIWDVTNTPIVGGHDVTPIDYDSQGVYVASWGRIYLITWAAWGSRRWLEEFDFLLSPDWYGSDNLAPNGINEATLVADMNLIVQGTIPDVGPVTPPNPTPTPPPTPIPPVGSSFLQVTAPMTAGPKRVIGGDGRQHGILHLTTGYSVGNYSLANPTGETMYTVQAPATTSFTDFYQWFVAFVTWMEQAVIHNVPQEVIQGIINQLPDPPVTWWEKKVLLLLLAQLYAQKMVAEQSHTSMISSLKA